MPAHLVGDRHVHVERRATLQPGRVEQAPVGMGTQPGGLPGGAAQVHRGGEGGVVVEVAAHAGQRGPHRDSERREILGRTEAGSEHESRGPVGAGAENHFSRTVDGAAIAFAHDDAGDLAPIQHQFARLGAGEDSEVLPATGLAVEVAHRGGHPLRRQARHRNAPVSFAFASVHVVDIAMAPALELLRNRLDERRPFVSGVAPYRDRAFAPVTGVLEVEVVFETAVEGLHVLPGPPLRPRPPPTLRSPEGVRAMPPSR